MLILVNKENEQHEVHIYQYTYFRSSQMPELIITYCFEHKNQDVLLNILF